MMDLEPHRCRRTDGNKWRCSKNVVPDQKYCQRHMYRGCLRSRKHVEACLVANPLGTNSSQDSDNFAAISAHSQSKPLSQSPLPLAFTQHCDSKSSQTSKTRSNVRGSKDFAITIDVVTNTIPTDPIFMINPKPIILNTSPNNSTIGDADGINAAADANLVPSYNPTILSIPCGPSMTADASTASSSINNQNNVSRITRSSKTGNSIGGIRNNVSAGFGFSPKSVLQGSRGSHFYSSYGDLEPGRCGRRDGKKWRCRREVVPNRKYCAAHLHRGAKKRIETSQPVANFVAVTASTRTHRPSVVTALCNADSVASHTIVTSKSIPDSLQLAGSVAESPSSNSSDATISDTTINDTSTTANEDF